MANLNPNTEGIVNYKKQESERKKKAVLMVLKNLISEGKQINKVEICREAGVSKTFIYANREELLNPIEEAVKEQCQRSNIIYKNKGMSDSSIEKVIESLKRRINILEEENKRLKRENAVLLGKMVKNMG
jgi:hypothetical protein